MNALRASNWWCLVFAEHPEDLGFDGTVRAASILRLPELKVEVGGETGTTAFYLCQHCDADEAAARDYKKPTRCISNCNEIS